MKLFSFLDSEAIGRVQSVDTASVTVWVDNIEALRALQVNRLVALYSSLAGQFLIGHIQKITRTVTNSPPARNEEMEQEYQEINLVKVALIGTVTSQLPPLAPTFSRTLETVPEIDSLCFPLEQNRLSSFMEIISSSSASEQRLSLGNYTLDQKAEAFINGNKLFQRHAVIVGSTGSGKSWATARLLEQVAQLRSANAIVLDMHGEYASMQGDGFTQLRVAGPSDVMAGYGLGDGAIHLPYWLMSYESLVSMFVDRSDQNAPNQAMVMSRAIVDAKKAHLQAGGHADVLANFTIDSPVPFAISSVLDELDRLNREMVQGARSEKQGDFHGKLSRLIQRLESKLGDRRLGFLFPGADVAQDYKWLDALVNLLLAGSSSKGGGGVKIINFSEVPSDILPLAAGMIARLAFSIQQWTHSEKRHPISLFCDEAHLYIPQHSSSAATDNAIEVFERVAKEGRKYGVGLVVISQRPAEVSRTVISQCNNLIAMRLTNGDDQSVVRRLLPDSLGGFGDVLPILDTGEALVVGDAILLPTRVRVSKPSHRPLSGTIDFWDKWAAPSSTQSLEKAVESWRRQAI